MSVLDALYKTYNRALENGMVDQTERFLQGPVLLPVYHSSKRSTGSNDMIEVTLDENGGFIKAEWMEKDKTAIYPITEKSIIRSGSTSAPHPLCDEFSYLSKEIDAKKHNDYIDGLNEWIDYMEEGHYNQLLKTISVYIEQETILGDCINSLFSGYQYIINEDYSVIISSGEKTKKTINFDKIFITFQVEMDESTRENLSVNRDRMLHQNYIDYVRYINFLLPQTKCDISGDTTYCVSRHRGLMGTAKLVSISNHNETYYGRFSDGEEIVRIGYEVSQKIHLMIKYFLENNQNKKQIGDSCFLINWFSDDIGNEERINLMDPISPDIEKDDNEVDDIPKTFGGGISSVINDYISGKTDHMNSSEKFYIMILDKISPGRISVKYFKEILKSDLLERVEDWYKTTSWPIYNGVANKIIEQTPSLFRYADTIFGLENAKGYMECKNKKLRSKTIERLLPCVIEHKRIPADLRNRMLENLCNRTSYDKAWNSVLAVGCSVFKKYQVDYQHKEGVSELLDTNKCDRSHLYGRLLAVYEKLEQDVLGKDSFTKESKRNTNAERLWSAYTKMPARTLMILEDKIRPYKERLLKNNFGAAKRYDIIITEIINLLSGIDNFEKEKNRALNEEFIFGYYAQKQEFYKKKENKEKTEDINDNEGGME